MSDKAALDKAIAGVESDIAELRIRLGKQKDALISQGKRAVWNAERAALTKPLYNLLERRWALSLIKHASSSAEALVNAKVIGILLPETIEGAIVPPATRLIKTDVMTKNGPMPMRTYDVLQFEASTPNVQPHELKSDAGKSGKGVLASSVKGGITHPDIEVHLRQKSPPGKQIATEKKLITEASKIPGAKIVVEGTDAVTGNVIRKHVDPQGLNLSRFSNYTDLPDVLTLGKPDPADLAPAPADKPAKKKKAQSTKAKRRAATRVKSAKNKPKQDIPVGDPAVAAEDAGSTRSAKKQPAKRKVDSKLTANRGVTAPSPNAPVEVADDAAGTPPAKKQPGKAADTTLAAKAKPTGPPRTLPTTPATTPVTTVPVSEEVTSVAPSAPKGDTPPAPGKGKFSLRLKISPKIKATGGFVLTIGFDLFIGWLEGRRISKMVKALLEKNSDKFTEVINAVATQEDFVKFRVGGNLEKGYQLYFVIRLYVTRTCSDGGCGVSGSISELFFMDVSFSRNKGTSFFPDATEEKGWGAEYQGMYGGAIAIFYNPIFDSGDKIHPATEDAADERLLEFYNRFIKREGAAPGDYAKKYFDEFRKYCLLFTESKAAALYLRIGLDDLLSDITMVELTHKQPYILMMPPHNLQFHEVIEKVKWGLASKISFIVFFYNLVIQMNVTDQIFYLEKYDKYFRLLDDGYTKCQVSCHRMLGDKRIIHRTTADDVREKNVFLQRNLSADPLLESKFLQ